MITSGTAVKYITRFPPLIFGNISDSIISIVHESCDTLVEPEFLAIRFAVA